MKRINGMPIVGIMLVDPAGNNLELDIYKLQEVGLAGIDGAFLDQSAVKDSHPDSVFFSPFDQGVLVHHVDMPGKHYYQHRIDVPFDLIETPVPLLGEVTLPEPAKCDQRKRLRGQIMHLLEKRFADSIDQTDAEEVTEEILDMVSLAPEDKT